MEQKSGLSYEAASQVDLWKSKKQFMRCNCVVTVEPGLEDSYIWLMSEQYTAQAKALYK